MVFGKYLKLLELRPLGYRVSRAGCSTYSNGQIQVAEGVVGPTCHASKFTSPWNSMEFSCNEPGRQTAGIFTNVSFSAEYLRTQHQMLQKDVINVTE